MAMRLTIMMMPLINMKHNISKLHILGDYYQHHFVKKMHLISIS